MFTGLIEQTGLVITNHNNGLANRLSISSSFAQLETGESIAVNGVCLTLLPMTSVGVLDFDISPETLQKTTVGYFAPGDLVNLERAMLASARFGGHYVSGHVDTTAQVHSIQTINEFIHLELSGFQHHTQAFLIPKGSITLDGVSLTINDVVEQRVQLMLVPHTILNTTLGGLKTGRPVNIEFDYFTRIVAHQLQLFGKLDYEVEL